MSLTQKQNILGSKASVHTMSDGTQYKGEAPVYSNMAAPHEPANFVKVSKGIPFIKL